jgi:hypothetical protein
MTARLPWLPSTVSVDGEYREVLARLYAIFETDIKNARLTLEGRCLWWDRRILTGETYEEAFWHLVTRKDKKTGERLHDPRRAERLPWLNPTVRHCGDPEVRTWDYREAGGKVRTYVWLERFDYVILFEKKTMRLGEVAFLVTAYHLDGEWMRQSLRRKHAKRLP